MASDYYDMMHPGLAQFAYLKCPNKIRAAYINAGGPSVPVETIARKLAVQGYRRSYQNVGEPTDEDGQVWRPRGFSGKFERKPPATAAQPKPKLVLTAEERARIAAIAATIPDRVVDKPHRVMRKKLDPTAQNFPSQLISFVLRRASMNRATFFIKRRRGKAKAVAAMIAVILREIDAKKYSYPKLARILHKADHTTIIHAVERWPFYAEEWPELEGVYEDVWRDLRGDDK